MRRPFVWLGGSFALGILISRTFSLPPLFSFFLLLVFIPTVFLYKRRIFFLGVLLFTFFLLGVLAEGTDRFLPPDHISRFEQEGRMALTGKIISLPESTKKGRREMISFILDLDDLYFERELRKVSGRVQVFLFNSDVSLEYGDRIRLWGNLQSPEGKANPGQFDYKRYLENEKIFRVFQAFGPRSVRILTRGSGSFLKKILAVRLAIKDRLDRSFSFPENEVIAALLIGMQKKIPEEIRDDFVRTGTMHSFATASGGRDYDLLTGKVAFSGTT